MAVMTIGSSNFTEPLVIYNADCWDGFCAAWLIKHHHWGKAEFVSMSYAPTVRREGDCWFDMTKSAAQLIWDWLYKTAPHRHAAQWLVDYTIDHDLRKWELGNFKEAQEVEVGGHQVLCVDTSSHFSEIAGALAKRNPFGAVWFERPDGKRQYSQSGRGLNDHPPNHPSVASPTRVGD